MKARLFHANPAFSRFSVRLLSLASVAALAVQPAEVAAQEDADALAMLRKEFANPPAGARPWTWFHVMSGNMTQEGLTRDLESLASVGVGGIVLFHVTQGIPYGNVRFNSPEHLDLIAHAAAECERLGLAFSFHNADGWSSTGGPWVTPAQSMKRVVWTEHAVEGGKVSVQLEQPSTREGFYEDIAVLAWPSLQGELADLAHSARLTSSDPELDISLVSDGDAATQSHMNVADGQSGWVQFSYDQPVTIRHLRVANIPVRDLVLSLEVSDDGETFRPLFAFPKTRILKEEWEVDTAFEPATGQHFRVVADRSFDFGEIALSQQDLLDNPAAHSTLGYKFGQSVPRARTVAATSVINPHHIIDLSQAIDGDGRLTTNLPAGNWTVMRFGYTSTGARNVNPSPEGSGLEVDKFDAAAFRHHYDAFLEPVITRAREVAPNALTGVMIDSYEVGGQNWTAGYENLFAQEFGMDLVPWLPIFAGRFVSSGEETSAIFARIRNLNADLANTNYYGEFARLMREDGLESLIQPYGNGPLDEVTVGSLASIPAGEFWVERDDLGNLNAAISAARTYGRPIAAAEAFTSIPRTNWNFSPEFGKKWGDRAWAAGVNQFFFHRFAHQANTRVIPGMTMNFWGSHFDRTQAWWDEGGAGWFAYMARGQHMLRQGTAVADVAMAVGSDSPVECPEKSTADGVLPIGVEFDCVDTPSLLERGRFENGQFVLQGGARYDMIWWPHRNAPRPAELEQLEAARAAGVPVAMANEGDDPAAVFASAGLVPRLQANGPMPGYTQRRTPEHDIFFIFNDAEEARAFDLCFRVDGAAGEAWNPVTGRSEMLAGDVADGCSRIAIDLAPYESRFLVFGEGMRFADQSAIAPSEPQLLSEMESGWTLSFDPLYGDAGTLDDVSLFDWSTSDVDEIRHFSGKATYRRSLSISTDDLGDEAEILLDLGQVENVATVRVNGETVDTLWTAPYVIDIARALRAGENAIEIEIANLWVNRLIGDAALPDTSGYVRDEKMPVRRMPDWYTANRPQPDGPRRTFTTMNFQQPDDPLVASGLIGPVSLWRHVN